MRTLPLIGAEIVHLDKHTFMWVQLTRFGMTPGNDQDVLAALIASPGYDDDYASPLHVGEERNEPAVHGRWRLSAIHTGMFEPTTAATAEARIRSWVDDQPWNDPTYRQPAEVHLRLQKVYDLLRTGDLYTLRNPREESMHVYGSSTGHLGFHEFVVINRVAGAVHVVVASDD
jgi:hypothetical protein